MSDGQVTFATLGKAVGFILQIDGGVRAQSIDGQERPLKVGDPVFYGETVVSNGSGTAVIEFVDGNHIVIGNKSIVEISDEVFTNKENEELTAEAAAEAEELQQAILAGLDPTQIQEAPAAGEETAEQETVTDVDITRDNAFSLPEYGYDTDNDIPSTESNVRNIQANADRTADEGGDLAVSPGGANVGFINSVEATGITSTLSGVDADVVSITVTYSDGATQINVPATQTGTTWSTGSTDISSLSDGDISVSAVVTDSSGNSSAVTGSVTLDTSADAGTVIVNSVTDDDVINAAEALATVSLTGTATGGDISTGDTVSVVVNENTYTGTVDSGGNWSIEVAGSDLVVDTDFDVVVSSSDAAGNTVESTGNSTHTVNTSVAVGSVSVASISADDVINASEAATTISVTGTATGGEISLGDTVTLVINETTYTTTVTADGSWTVEVAGSDLAADTSFDAVVTSSDSAQNTVQSTGSSIHTVDISATEGSVTVDAITSDDVINDSEATSTINVTGTATGGDIASGDVVTMTINGVDYGTTVDADGNWAVDVAGGDLALDTTFDVVVLSSDAAENTVQSTGSSTHTVDTLATVGTVTVAAITSDDVINAAEAATTISVTGTATGGDISSGDTVTLVVNDNTYTSIVDVNGDWIVDVAGSDLAADTTFDAVVTSSDTAQNTVESTGSSSHSIDDTALQVNIDIDTITADSYLNASEAAGDVIVTGTVTGDDYDTGTVTLEVNGTSYTGELTDGSFAISVAGSDLENDSDEILAASVVVTNSIGQEGIADSTERYFVDTTARATITVNSITDDDVINAEESAGTVTVTGSVGFDAGPGDTVELVINGTTYTGTVLANSTWSIDVAGSDLAQDNSFQASVSGEDAYGNSYQASFTSTHTVDLEATAGTVTVNAITADDVINASEATGTVSVTGTATGGDIAAGDTVTLVINETTYTATVAADNSWSVDVAGSDLVNDTAFEAVVTSSDEAGNIVESTGASAHTVDNTVSVVLTASDATEGGNITYTVNLVDANGDAVSTATAMTVTLDNGTEINIAANASTGNNTYTVPDDVYAEAGEQLVANIIGTTGGGFEVLDTSDTATSNLSDDSDITTVSLSATGSVAEGGTITYTATLTNAAETDVTVTLDSGETITILAAGTDLGDGELADGLSGTTTVTASDDVYQGGDSASDFIESATGGNFEQLDVIATPANTTITDDSDITTVSLSATDVNDDASSVTFNILLSNTAQTQVTITTDQGDVVISAGESSGSLIVNLTENDISSGSITATVSAVSGGNYEAVDFSSATTTAQILDITAPLAPVVTITEDINNDGFINDSEINGDINVSISLSGTNAVEGDTLTVNGSDILLTDSHITAGEVLTTVVAPAEGSNLTVSATITDVAGNESLPGSDSAILDTTAQGQIDVDVITADSIINAAESATDETVAITGHVGNDALPGDTITISLDGAVIGTGSVSSDQDESGNYLYSVDVLGSTLANTSMSNPTIIATVSGTDAAGNAFSTSSSEVYQVDTIANVYVALDDDATDSSSDYVVNYDEQGSLSVSGFVEEGGAVSSITITDSSNASITVSGAGITDENGDFTSSIDVSSLSDGTLFVTVNASDEAGNSVDSSAVTISKDTSADADATSFAVTVSDADIDEDEVSAVSVSLSGVDSDADSVVVTFTDASEPANTVTTTATQSGSSWTVTATDLSSLDDGAISISAVVTDDAGNTSTATDSLTLDTINSVPVIGSVSDATVSEEGLSDANADTSGDSDTTNVSTVTTDFNVSDADNSDAELSVTLSAPTASLTSDGVAIVWSGDGTDTIIGSAGGVEVIRVEASDPAAGVASYTTTLSAPIDHSDSSSEDSLSFDLDIVVSDGTSNTTETVSITVEDDSPDVLNSTASLMVVAADSIVVKNLEAGFSDTTYSPDENEVTETDNDSDNLIDSIAWGTGDNGASSLELTDDSGLTSSTGSSVDSGASFDLLDFEHVNTAVSSSTSSLESADLDVTFDLEINGTTTAVTITLAIAHDATSNSGSNTDDTVTITTQSVDVLVDGQTYTVVIEGFTDSNDNTVTTISTAEGVTGNYALTAHIDAPAAAEQSVSGTVSTDAGADGFDYVTWGDVSSTYGTMTANSDGTYSFVLADDANVTETVVETFTYQVVDNDGDSVTSTLSLTLEPEDTTADEGDDFTVTVATDDAITNDAESSHVSVTLSGVDDDAQSVVVSFTDSSNSVVTTTATETDGVWSVADTDLSGLLDGSISVSAVVTDDASNTSTATSILDLDTSADTDSNFAISLDSSDVTVGDAEADNVSVNLSGVDGDASSVLVTFTDESNTTITSTATYDVTDGWTVADTDISTLADGAVSVSAVVTDDAGNTSTASDSLTLDTSNIVMGLSAQYYAYDDSTNGNLDSIADAMVVVDSNDPTATFIATEISYGLGSGDIGKDENLESFLGDDAASLSDNPTTETEDGIIYMSGDLALEAGTYNFQVYADDGYQIKVDGVVVASVDGNQSPTTTTHADFTIDSSGEHTIEIVYWDQGGNYVFDVDLSADGGASYSPLGGSDYPTSFTQNDDGVFAVVVNSSDETVNDTESSDVSLSFTGVDDDVTAITVTYSDSSSSVTGNATLVSGSWVLSDTDISSLTDGDISVTAVATDSGNETFTATNSLTLDTSADAGTVTVDAITSDDSVTTTESASTISVTGSASGGDIANGDTVSMTINGVSYSTTLDASGNWSVDVAGTDLYADTSFDVVVSSTDDAGNTVSSTGASEHTIVETTTLGLNAAFYAYDDSTNGNLTSVADALDVINSNDPTATFIATELDYSRGSGNLGTDENLESFLGDDAASLSENPSTSTEDAVLHLNGDVSIDAGEYYIKVAADDGYRVLIDGEIVITSDSNGESYDTFTIAESGNHSIEIIYYDQGASYLLNVALSPYSEDAAELDFNNVGSNTYPTSFASNYVGDVTSLEDRIAAFTQDEATYGEDGTLSVTAANNGKITATGTSDNEIITGEDKQDTLSGGAGNDLIDGGDGSDLIHGDAGNDHILGGDKKDELYGDDGDDWIEGGDGADEIYGGLGSDLLEGGDKADIIYGGNDDSAEADGDDLIYGGDGNDELYGEAGDDILIGGEKADDLFGGADDDILFGGSGNDTLTGGTGADLFILDDTNDTITDFDASEDSLDITELLSGLDGEPGEGASTDAIAEFLSNNVTVTDGHVKVDGSDVATFSGTSTFDSTGDGSVNSSDSVSIIYNDQEYTINIDG